MMNLRIGKSLDIVRQHSGTATDAESSSVMDAGLHLRKATTNTTCVTRLLVKKMKKREELWREEEEDRSIEE